MFNFSSLPPTVHAGGIAHSPSQGKMALGKSDEVKQGVFDPAVLRAKVPSPGWAEMSRTGHHNATYANMEFVSTNRWWLRGGQQSAAPGC